MNWKLGALVLVLAMVGFAGCGFGESGYHDNMCQSMDVPVVDVWCVYISDCNDHDLCTLDSCNKETGKCYHKPDPLCGGYECNPGVSDDPFCDDHDPCTADTCTAEAGKCSHVPVNGCKNCKLGAGDSSCDDGNPCTTDSCIPVSPKDEVGRCEHVAIDGCVNTVPCQSDKDCGNKCGFNLQTGKSFWIALGGCINSFCDRLDYSAPCKENEKCVDGRGCMPICASDKDCDDSDPCTESSCVDEVCQLVLIPNCTP